ncbi:MAG: ferrous iron transporter B [Candidatus Aenigmarchaeota archaeon]|nr:ferrous iron transporter B [Candidatus Aenigmarchaeota archaeon]
MKILLMGNQNVGKSTFFSRITGLNVVSSNYAGTTVEIKKGRMKLGGKSVEVIDVPGIYHLDAGSKAEEVAVDILKEGDLVINVIDVTNLERNLYLTLQLMEKKIPVVLALNFWNETKRKGIEIDVKKLEEILKVPVVPVVATTGKGIKKLVSKLPKAKAHARKRTDKERWAKVGEIIDSVQKIGKEHYTIPERLKDLSIKPVTGIPIAVLIMAFAFYIVRFIGENLIGCVFEPLFNLYLPVLERLSAYLGSGFVHDILIGALIEGEINFVESMGLLTTGLFVPIVMVLPYVFAFYLILGFLEDSGYLPRLATLMDNIMHKLGMHGLAIIPMLLGLGCNVPGAMSTRILETKRQRFIAITLMAIAVPCMAQIAIVFGLLGEYGINALGIFFMTLFAVWFVLGLLLNRFIRGDSPETFIEIPPYRIPYFKGLVKKLWMRMRSFLTEAIPFVFLGVLVVNVLYVLKIIDFISNITAPIVVNVLGLPKEAVASLVVGFLRKDVAVGMLLPLGLTVKQLIISSVVLTMYFPCIATFVILFKELGLKDTVKSVGIMIALTLLVGGLLNLIL